MESMFRFTIRFIINYTAYIMSGTDDPNDSTPVVEKREDIPSFV